MKAKMLAARAFIAEEEGRLKMADGEARGGQAPKRGLQGA